MPFTNQETELTLACRIIPNYSELDQEIRTAFEAKAPEFKTIICNTLKNIENKYADLSMWDMVSSYLYISNPYDEFEKKFYSDMNELIETNEHVQFRYYFPVIASLNPHLDLMPEEDQVALFNELKDKIIALKKLQTEQEEKQASFNSLSGYDSELEGARNALEEHTALYDTKKNELNQEIATKTRRVKIRYALQSIIKQLLFLRDEGNLNALINNIEAALDADANLSLEAAITATLKNTLENILKNDNPTPPTIDFTTFYESQVNDILEQLQNNSFNLNDFLTDYTNNLDSYLSKTLLPEWKTDNPLESLNITRSLFTQLKEKLVNNTFLQEFSTAHTMLQWANYASQESSYIAFIDIFTTIRLMDDVNKSKQIFSNLFMAPISPLYDEYYYLAKFESSSFKKLIKSILPIFIILAVTIAIFYFIIMPLALPEIVILMTFIPVFVASLLIAAQYIRIKNMLYEGIQILCYSTPFERPEFQCNERMFSVFEKPYAERVRKFYINELIACDKKEDDFQSILKEKQAFTEAQLKEREDNLKQRALLRAQWFDIGNHEISIEETKNIVRQQLYSAITRDHSHLSNQLVTRQFAPMKEVMKKNLEDKLSPPNNNAVRRLTPGRHTLFEVSEDIESRTKRLNHRIEVYNTLAPNPAD